MSRAHSVHELPTIEKGFSLAIGLMIIDHFERSEK
jgi:hypothetical protein